MCIHTCERFHPHLIKLRLAGAQHPPPQVDDDHPLGGVGTPPPQVDDDHLLGVGRPPPVSAVDPPPQERCAPALGCAIDELAGLDFSTHMLWLGVAIRERAAARPNSYKKKRPSLSTARALNGFGVSEGDHVYHEECQFH